MSFCLKKIIMITAQISIVTYKRPHWLERLLTNLSLQTTDNLVGLTILVVDNDCSEQIKGLVQSANSTSPHEILYIAEEKRGIVSARNTAVKYFLNSESDFLLFIDDDEWPVRNDWALVLINALHNSNYDIAASAVISVGDDEAPDWAVKLIYGQCGFVDGDELSIFYTGNVIISRYVLEKLTPAFDERFSKTGSSDFHFALRCRKSGYRAVYVDSPVYESFPASKANVDWFIRRGFRSGIGYSRSYVFEDGLLKAFPRCLAMSLFRFIRGVLYLLQGGGTMSKMRIVDGLFRMSSALGTVVGCFGVKYNEYKTIHGK